MKVKEQRLVGRGKPLDDPKTLQDYGIGNNNNIDMTLRLNGGKVCLKKSFDLIE